MTTKHDPVSNPFAAFNPFAANQFGDFFGAFGEHTSGMFTRLATFGQEELARGIKRTMDTNQSFLNDLSKCKSLPEVFSVQQAWLARATSDWAEDMGRVGEFMWQTVATITDDKADTLRTGAAEGGQIVDVAARAKEGARRAA